ncbi:hypothetical protein HPO96_22715 [Kribbella sandramycini]|uniref:Outer membrane channel protein CpnT-like N-terminal domain-containing protein n=1 Tax=Kribbella sandramycini TaxID=60450 RepID=A0A7Y4L2E5_9ACTN|nr:hypothetical protein [Kribbella sandramycini]MBB6566273.1 hypothetical protein [Kribbella sandramycini]NOL43064.1 hypothetical protein [Kribbella sandramycini]
MIPEPNTYLWTELQRFSDAYIFPRTNEDAVRDLGNLWNDLSVALKAALGDAGAVNGSLAMAWKDSLAIGYRYDVDQIVNGAEGYQTLAKAYFDVAQLCWGHAKTVAQIKSQIWSEVIMTGVFFVATLLLPPGIGDLVRFQLLRTLITRFSSIIRTAAGLARTAGRSPLGNLVRELGQESIEESITQLVANGIDIARGYEDKIDLGKLAVAAAAGPLGAGMGKIINPVGRLGSAPALRVADTLRISGRARDVIGMSGHTFVVNGITSPVSSLVAQSAYDGTFFQQGFGDYLHAVATGGPMAGLLGAGRVGAVHTADAIGQWAGGKLGITPPNITLDTIPPGGGPPGGFETAVPPATTTPGGAQLEGAPSSQPGSSAGAAGSNAVADVDGSRPAGLADHSNPGRQGGVDVDGHANRQQSAAQQEQQEYELQEAVDDTADAVDGATSDESTAGGVPVSDLESGAPAELGDRSSAQAPEAGAHRDGTQASTDGRGGTTVEGDSRSDAVAEGGSRGEVVVEGADSATVEGGSWSDVVVEGTDGGLVEQPGVESGVVGTQARADAVDVRSSEARAAEPRATRVGRDELTESEQPAEETGATLASEDSSPATVAPVVEDAAVNESAVEPEANEAAVDESAVEPAVDEAAEATGVLAVAPAAGVPAPPGPPGRPPDGNAARLPDFVADGPLQDHRTLLRLIAELVRSPVLRVFADVRAIVPTGPSTVDVITRTGERVEVVIEVGPVADRHPAEFRLAADGTPQAIVRISEQIKDADVGRALVHELRELGHLFGGRPVDGPAFDAHQQGRLGELLLLHDELKQEVSPSEARRAEYAAKMRQLLDDIGLARPESDQRLDALNVRDRAGVRRAAAFALDPTPEAAPEEAAEFGWFNEASPVVTEEQAGPTAEVTPWVSSGLPGKDSEVGPNWARWVVDKVTGFPRIAEARLFADFGQTRRPNADRVERKRAVARGEGHPGAGKDDGGHAIAWRFFAKVAATMNYFPQAGSFNKGAFESLENEIGDWLAQGWRVDLKVFFPPNEPRPTSVTVVYAVSDPANPDHVIWTGGRTWENTDVPHRAELTGPNHTRSPLPEGRLEGTQKRTDAQYQRYQKRSIEAFDPDRSNLFEPDAVVGNAERLGPFEATGEVKEHQQLWAQIATELGLAKLAQFVDVRWIQVAPDGRSLILQPWSGRPISIQLEVGPVADGHPAEVRLRQARRLAVVRISEQIEFADVGRALVHELREAGHAFSGRPDGGPRFSDHQQGRVAELLYLDHERRMAEGNEQLQAWYAERMRELLHDLGLQRAAGDARVDALERHHDRAAVRRAAAALDPVPQPIPLDPPTVPAQPLTDPPTVGIIRGVVRSLLHLDGLARWFPNIDQVEYEMTAALSDPAVLAAAGITAVQPGPGNLLHLQSVHGWITVELSAGQVERGLAGEFVVENDGRTPIRLVVSSRAADRSVARIIANLLSQLVNLDSSGVPNALESGSEVKRPVPLSQEDNGRLAEARLLNHRLATTPRARLIERLQLRTELRALLEELAVVHGQKQASFRRLALSDADAAMLKQHLKGWQVGDTRLQQRTYLRRDATAGLVPTTIAAAGVLVLTGNVGAALGTLLPTAVVTAALAVGQRWLDAAKQWAADEGGRKRKAAHAKHLPSLADAIEADPRTVAGKPLPELEGKALIPARWRYLVKIWVPAGLGVGTALLLAPLFPPLPVIVGTVGVALLRSFTEQYTDGRKKELETLRNEELALRFAADPAAYHNQLGAWLAQLYEAITGRPATFATGRPDGPLPSLDEESVYSDAPDHLGLAARRAVGPAQPGADPDTTSLGRQLDEMGEMLVLGILTMAASVVASGVANAVIQRFTDRASAAVSEYNLEVAGAREAQEVNAALGRLLQEAVALSELASRLRGGPPVPERLADRTVDRFRGRFPVVPQPPAVPDPYGGPSGRTPRWVFALYGAGAVVTGGVLLYVDSLVQLGPTTYTTVLLAAAAQLFAAPIAQWLWNKADAERSLHRARADNKRAPSRQAVADQVGLLRYQLDRLGLAAGDVLASAADTAELPVPGADLSASTDRVRAAARTARLAIVPRVSEPPRVGFQERQDLHASLDEIEQQADTVDELTEAVSRGEPGAEARLAEARDRLDELLAENAVHPDHRVRLPALETVDPSAGARIVGNPLQRAQALAAEAWRRLIAEPEGTPYRVRRATALERVGKSLDMLEQFLAAATPGRRTDAVEAALTEAVKMINAFKAIQRRAGVPGDTRLDDLALRRYIHDLLRARDRRPPIPPA